MDYLLTIVKFTSLILAAAFAILGTVTDYKVDGKVTKWGRVAIIGVVVSGLLSSILLGLEERNKAAEKDKTDKAKIEDLNKANQEKEDLYKRFDDLFKNTEKNLDATQENIKRTEETLTRTDAISKDVKNSLVTQKSLAEQTGSISGDVKKNLKTQSRLMAESKGISKTVKESSQKQKTLLENSEKALAEIKNQVNTQQRIFDNIVALSNGQNELQVKQTDLLQNTLRSLNPFSNLAVAYYLKFDLNDSRLKSYKEELVKIAETDFKERFEFKSYISVRRSDDLKKIEKIEVVIGKTDQKTIDNPREFILNNPLFFMSFYKDASSVAELPGKASDLSVTTLTNRKDPSINTILFEKTKNEGAHVTLSIVFEGDKKGIYLSVQSNTLDFDYSTGKIISFVDLTDAMMVTVIPKESSLLGLEFRTGEDYSLRYCLPSEKFTENKEESLPRLKRLFHSIQKDDLKPSSCVFIP